VRRAREPVGAREAEVRARRVAPKSRLTFPIVTASGDFAVQLVILGSIVVPLAILAVVCWWFWQHRED
jgi:hypothetical protein